MRKPNNHFIRKEDIIYTPQVGVSDGLASGLSAVEGDRRLVGQMFEAAKAIQQSEDNLRQSITEQQNKVLLLDAVNKISSINQSLYEELKYDPDRFKVASNEQSAKVINELPLLLRDAAKNSFLQQQNGYYYKALNNKREYLDKQSFDQTQLSIKNLAKDASSSIVGLFNANPSLNIQSQIGLGSSIAQAMQFLGAKNSYGMDLFSPLQKEKLSQGFYGTLFEGFSELKFNSLKTTDEKLGFIKDVLFGSAKIAYKDPTTNADVEIPSSMLDQDGRNSIAKTLSEKLKQETFQEKEAVEKQHVQNVIAGKKLPAYKVEKYLNATNTTYKDFKQQYGLENIVGADLQTIAATTNSIVGFVGKTRSLPTELKNDIESWKNSGNPMLFKMASDVTGFVFANFPEISNKMNSKSLAECLTMYNLTKAGVPVDQAYTTVFQNFWKMSAETKQQRQKDFDKLKTIHFGELIQKNFVASGAGDEYKKQLMFVAEQLYISGADIGVAKSVAENALSSRWGSSIINGEEYFTALPPEKYYAMEGILTPKNMRDRLNEFVKPYVTDVNNIVVIADDQTYTEVYGDAPTPSYGLWHKNEMGYLEVVLNDAGQHVRVGKNLWRDDLESYYEQLSSDLNKVDVEIASLWKQVHDENPSVSLPYGMYVPYKKTTQSKLDEIKAKESERNKIKENIKLTKEERDRRLVKKNPGLAVSFNKASLLKLIRE